MENFNKGMALFTLRASRVTESQLREAEGMRVQEGVIEDEMKRNLQVIQVTYEKLLNGFVEASQDRFLKLEKAVNIIDGHLGRIADKVLNREIGSSRDSLNLGSARSILRSGRIMNNGRSEEITDKSNNSPRERNNEEKGILSYVVYLGSHAHGAQADLDRVTQTHHHFLASFLGSTDKARDSIFYSYKRHINGFAAMLEEEEAAQISRHSDVVSVFLNKGRKLHTTHSWDFMLLEKNGIVHHSSAWNKARFGQDTIIANLDTGVWPQSQSFSDHGFGPVPSRWKGICDNDTTAGVPCNSTLDREFQAFVKLRNGERFKGTSLSKPLPEDKFYPLVTGEQAKAANASAAEAFLCKEGTLDPEKVKGKILACLRGDTARVDKGRQAALAGAVGMILCNDKDSGNEIIADPHLLPTSQITYKDGAAVIAYINSTDDPLGFITVPSAKLGTKPAPFMAAFSSQGPNTITAEILKPDITAPGVNIIAAYSEATSPTGLTFDNRRVPFNTDSGTSMSCPHVSGVAGLLKTLHPDWSPAAIRSAITTTARTRDNTVNPMLNAAQVKATPFSYGGGHIRPNRAMDPGLVYDLSTNDYLDFLCSVGYNQTVIEPFSGGTYECPSPANNILDFNYPSITVPKFSGSVTVTRKLVNVGSPGTYAARVREPVGISVSVEPNILRYEKIGEEKSFKVTLKAKWPCAAKNYTFGGLTWTDGKHYVRSPIVVAAS
ncbi:hypothetical protein LWI28_001538 [Acer negundo]|uniref:Subtilisin-like protease n=1 Tax=Acer negundo TaxID=4023 RepID=A0AAD5NIA5_ACENE|nr:hypothetical protein LWI28_001538 [Acer negundo]